MTRRVEHLLLLALLLLGLFGLTRADPWLRRLGMMEPVAPAMLYLWNLGRRRVAVIEAALQHFRSDSPPVAPALVPYRNPRRVASNGQIVFQFTSPASAEGSNMALLTTFDFSNIVGSVDSAIEGAVRRQFAGSSNLQPELNAAIEANVALVQRIVEQYVLARAQLMAGKVLDQLAQKFPAAAAEAAALKARIGA